MNAASLGPLVKARGTVKAFRNDADWRTLDGTDDPDADLDAYTASGEWTDAAPVSGTSWDDDRGTDAGVHAVRVRQASADRYPGMAWVGPTWVEADG